MSVDCATLTHCVSARAEKFYFGEFLGAYNTYDYAFEGVFGELGDSVSMFCVYRMILSRYETIV